MQQKSGRNLRHMKNLYLNSRFISSNQILKNLLYFYNYVNFVRKLTFRPGFRRQSLPEPGYLFGWSWIRIRIATNVWIHFTDWRTSNQMKTTANTKVHWQLLRYGSLCRSFSMSGVRSLRSLEVTGWGWPRKDCYHQSMGRFFSFSNRLAP